MEENKKQIELNEYLLDKTLISMYVKGYNMKYIIKYYYRKKNKSCKPIKIEGQLYFPPKIYTMKDCELYVHEVIYKYLMGYYETGFSA